MCKKSKILIGIWAILVVICGIAGALMNLHIALYYIGWTALILWVLQSILILAITAYENIQITKNFKVYKEDLDSLILFCQKGIKKYWIYRSVGSCYLQLGICYLLKNDLKQAKEILPISLKDNWKESYYPNFILAILENNMEQAKLLYKKISSLSSFFDQQKRISTKLMKMIETKTFDEEIYEETIYPCIKEFCLKYKTEEK